MKKKKKKKINITKLQIKRKEKYFSIMGSTNY